MYKVASKSSGSGSEVKESTKYLTQHYVITKHAVFMAIIVGGVANPTTSLCIMVLDFVLTVKGGWTIVKKHKKGFDVKGMNWKITFDLV